MSKTSINEIEVNGIVYVPKDSQKQAESLDGMPYVIVRTYSAGVFAGFLESKNGQEGVIRKARRIWYWSGAASLSQLAMSGTSDPDNCKFPEIVDKIELTNIIEVLHCTDKAQKSIGEVKIWKQ